jgi:hypothetical protein
VVFKWKVDHTPLVLECTEDGECLWNTTSEHCTNKTTGENALQEILQEMNFLQLTIWGRKIEN